MKDYVSLHNHTIFSLQDSLIKPSELFKRAKELGQSAIAVTDHGTLGGAWECLQQANAAGVKLIIGSEMYFLDDLETCTPGTRLRHIILLAKNHEGYKNLLLAQKVGFDNALVNKNKVIPRIDWKILERVAPGLVCLTACGGGILGQLLNTRKLEEAKKQAVKLKEIFGDNLGLEIQPHAMKRVSNRFNDYEDQAFVNHQLIKMGRELGIRVVATVDAHYLNPEDHIHHDVLLAGAAKQTIFSGNRLKYPNEFYMKSREQVSEFFVSRYKEQAEEFCDNSLYFAGLCEHAEWVDPKFSNPTGKELPEFPVKDEPDYQEFLAAYGGNLPGKEDDCYLRWKCEKELAVRPLKAGNMSVYQERLEEELEVLALKGFSSYMLIVADYLNWARKNGIAVSAGRGSIAGSLAGYLLNIHKADPIKYETIFARFLNKEKDGLPDIDCDFQSSGRDRVKEYLKQKYGKDNVALVSNLSTITAKVYARDMARIFQYGGDIKSAIAIGDAIADAIPDDIKKVTDALEFAPLFQEYANSEKYGSLKTHGAALSGKPKGFSSNAAGAILSKRPLIEIIPLRKDGHGNLCIEYTKDTAESNGLAKMDLLGLETLDIIAQTLKFIAICGKEAPEEFDYDAYDESSYDLISSGNTLGVFQLGESGGTIDLCKKIKPKSIDDLSIINSLARPSAADIRAPFVRIRNGEEKMKLLHPKLERAFGKTLSFGLFEECLLYLAQDIAGWNLNKADGLRKLTKDKGKNPEKAKKLRQEFIEGAVKNDVDEKVAIKIWDEVVDKFQGYGFNRSLCLFTNIDIYTPDGTFLETKTIENVSAGDYVRSRDENHKRDIFIPVLNKHDHGMLPLVEVELTSGQKVKCTMNHKFRTEETGEMLPLWEIIDNDLTIVIAK